MVCTTIEVGPSEKTLLKIREKDCCVNLEICSLLIVQFVSPAENTLQEIELLYTHLHPVCITPQHREENWKIENDYLP